MTIYENNFITTHRMGVSSQFRSKARQDKVQRNRLLIWVVRINSKRR